MRSIAVTAFHSLGRKIDLGAFAEQLKELHAEPSLRMAEWTASTPYATNRIAALHRFARDPLYQTWAQRFRDNVTAPEGTEAGETVYASFWRRTLAFGIDVLVVQTIIPAVNAVRAQLTPAQVAAAKATANDPQTPRWVAGLVNDLGNAMPHAMVTFNPRGALFWAAFFVYGVVLVALVGQTFGMMVSDLRVVGANREARVGLRRALGRYVSLTLSIFAVFGWFSIFRRVQPYEKMSRTRLVSGSAAVRS
jgi:hypothetical protein